MVKDPAKDPREGRSGPGGPVCWYRETADQPSKGFIQSLVSFPSDHLIVHGILCTVHQAIEPSYTGLLHSVSDCIRRLCFYPSEHTVLRTGMSPGTYGAECDFV